MKNNLWIKLLSLPIFLLTTISQASTPLWTFAPLTATTINISPGNTATVQYSVTNQSRRTHALEFIPIPGITQVTGGGNCQNPFVLAYQQSCILTLEVSGSMVLPDIHGGPKVCQQGSQLQCYQPSINNILNITRTDIPPMSATLTSSVTSLALAVSGAPRIITITNIGPGAATNVSYTPTPALPPGTNIIPAGCGSIMPGANCILTIVPGATASAAPGDTSPVPITLTIEGTNTNILTPTLNILAYGSVYQSGYIFSFDDTTPNTASVGGKITSLVDQASAPPPSSPPWSTDALGFPVSDNIPGITETSTAPPDACDGNVDGSCDTAVIVAFYPTITLSFYAAGLCKATIGGYTDWYLPAICELGYDATSQGSGCGTALAPTIQNIKSNLYDLGIGGFGTSGYTSATESATDPTNDMWVDYFLLNFQASQPKFGGFPTRCVRILTQ
jgi:hypothetical protein